MSTRKITNTIKLYHVIGRFLESLGIFRKFGLGNVNTTGAIFASIHIANPDANQHYSKENIALAEKLITYSIALNDVKDLQTFIAQANDPQIQQDYQDAEKSVEKLEQELLTACKATPHSDLITGFIREISELEDWVQHNSNTEWTLQDAKICKELTNGINTLAVYALTTGRSDLFHKTDYQKLKKDPCSYLQDKYHWLLQNDPHSKHQCAIVMLWNLAMIAQTYDDQTDRRIDMHCHLNTLATVMYKKELKKQQVHITEVTDLNALDKEIAATIDATMHELRKMYSKQARKYGYLPISLHDKFFNSFLLFLKTIVVLCSKLPKPIRMFIAKRSPFLREKWIIKRKV